MTARADILSNLDPVARRLAVLFAIWLVCLAVLAFISPYFFQQSTIPYLLQYLPILGLVGLGQTLVILAGGPGIDLSVGSILSLVGILIAALMNAGSGVFIACIAGLLGGAALGALNGILIERCRIPSLMATLATFFALGGLAVAITGGRPLSGFPEGFAWLGQGRTLGLPNAFLFLLFPVSVILHVMLTRTTVGRHIVACGNGDQAARLVGIDVGGLRIGLYALSGVLAALGSIVSLSWFMAARPDAGDGMELLSVTIAVLGGTSIFGGSGSIAGTLMALLVVTTLQIGLQLANISPAWQLGVIGLLLIGSVSFKELRMLFVSGFVRRIS